MGRGSTLANLTFEYYTGVYNTKEPLQTVTVGDSSLCCCTCVMYFER